MVGNNGSQLTMQGLVQCVSADKEGGSCGTLQPTDDLCVVDPTE